MTELKSDLKIKAALKLAQSNYKIATVIRKGDRDNGAIYVKLRRQDQRCILRGRYLDENGFYSWKDIINFNDTWLEEDKIDIRLDKELQFDPDLWILEIETNELWNPLEEIYND